MEDVSVDGRIILKLILKKHSVRLWIGFSRLRIGPTAGSCEHGNGLLVSWGGGGGLADRLLEGLYPTTTRSCKELHSFK
jgi:hypothetical protein